MHMKTNTTTKRNATLNALQIERADKFALSMKPLVDDLRAYGLTFHQIAEALNETDVRTPKGHFWAYKSVRNLYARLDAIEARRPLRQPIRS